MEHKMVTIPFDKSKVEKSAGRWRIHPFIETTQPNCALQRQHKQCA